MTKVAIFLYCIKLSPLLPNWFELFAHQTTFFLELECFDVKNWIEN